MKDLIIVTISIVLSRKVLDVFIDKILEKRLVDNSKLFLLSHWDASCDSFVFLFEAVTVHLADHVNKLLGVVNFDVAEDVAEKVENWHQSCIDLGFIVVLAVVLDQVELSVLSEADELLDFFVKKFKLDISWFPLREVIWWCMHAIVVTFRRTVIKFLKRNGFELGFMTLRCQFAKNSLKKLSEVFLFVSRH